MKQTYILDEIKGRILDLWIKINNEDIKGNEYYKYIEDILLKHFQITYFEYYVYENTELRLIYQREVPKLHLIKTGNFLPNAEQEEVPPEILRQVQQFSPQIDSSFIIGDENNIAGVLFIKTSEKWQLFKESTNLKELQKIFYETANISQRQYAMKEENSLNEKLLRITEVFHSTMDIDHIVQAIMQELKENFAECKYELILSNDQKREFPENVLVFDYSNEKPETLEAFVSGELTREFLPATNEVILNAPIKGMQGTYGVIRLAINEGDQFTLKKEMRLQFLGNSSGKALENAKLYAQAHGLVADLQLINESAHRLNMNLTQEEMLLYLADLMKESFNPNEIAFVLMEDEVQIKTGTSPYFYTGESSNYLKYVMAHFKTSQEPLFNADIKPSIIENTPFKSLMAVPIIIGEKVQGFSLVVHEKPYFFSFDSYKLMQSIIRHSSLAISNVILREKLQELVDRDHLTKLYSRNYLETYVKASVEKDRSGLFVLFDIDDFKLVNDTYGHQQGDRTLEKVAQIIEKEVQEVGICARWGGEEMAIYFPNLNAEIAIPIIEQISYKIAHFTTPKVTVSAGISIWNENQPSTYQLIFKQADDVLYSAKTNGKNQFLIHEVKSSNEKEMH